MYGPWAYLRENLDDIIMLIVALWELKFTSKIRILDEYEKFIEEEEERLKEVNQNIKEIYWD